MTTDLEVRDDGMSVTLFGTDNPAEALAQMTQVAATLADVVRSQHLVVRIQQSEHVRVEGWTFLGSLLGVFPVVIWTRPVLDLENGPGHLGWEARVEARTRSGEIVGAAESECLRTENTWSRRDDYALRSMAQTRAVSKALRLPLGFVMQLAGFNPTPAEEMPTIEHKASGGEPMAVEPGAPVSQAPTPTGEPASPPVDLYDPDIPFGDAPDPALQPPRVRYISKGQRDRLWAIVTESKTPEDDVRAIVIELTGQESTAKIPAGRVYDSVITAIQAKGTT